MKKFLSIAATMVCALLVGVSCTPDEPIDPPTLSVTQPAAPYSYEAGTGEVSFTLEYPVNGVDIVLGEPSAEWLHSLAVVAEESKITFAYDANNTTPDSANREASFTVSYDELEPITVVVSQGVPPFPFDVEITRKSPLGCDATITPLDMESTYTYIATTDAAIAEAAALAGTGEYANLTTGAEVLIYEEASGWISYMWNSRPKTGVCEATESDYSNPLEWATIGEDEKPCIVVSGITKNDEGEILITTFAQVVDVELVAMPELNVPEAQLTQNVEPTEGEFVLDLTVTNPLEGDSITYTTKSAWVKPSLNANGGLNVENGKLTVEYEANPYNTPRSATLTFRYNYATSVDVTVNQPANADAAPITFEITVKESHWDHILVDIVPSDENVTCCVGAVSKAYYDGGNYKYDGTDAKLVENTVNTYGTQRFKGKQTDLKITKFDPTPSASNSGSEYYVWVYAADGEYGSATTAISDVEKVLTTVVYDKPELSIVKVEQIVDGETTVVEMTGSGYYAAYNVSPKSAEIVVTYEVKNPTANGEVRFNGNPSDYYDVITDDSWTMDAENNQFSFTTNPYNAEQSSHSATIYVAYYADGAGDSSTDATASVKINQLSE